MIQCGQKNCEKLAEFRALWPGDEAARPVCAEHARAVKNIGSALGCRVPVAPITPEEHAAAVAERLEGTT